MLSVIWVHSFKCLDAGELGAGMALDGIFTFKDNFVLSSFILFFLFIKSIIFIVSALTSDYFCYIKVRRYYKNFLEINGE